MCQYIRECDASMVLSPHICINIVIADGSLYLIRTKPHGKSSLRTINSILESDAKDASYKYALLRGTIDLCQRYSHLREEVDGRVRRRPAGHEYYTAADAVGSASGIGVFSVLGKY